MNEPTEELRILMLEDVPTDAELVVQTLREEGLDFISLRVDTEAAFIREMDKFAPHIVLSDYRLPSYSGRSALEYSRRMYPHIPFIMVTGALGDEAAVELLKSGAKDYVLKERLGRLPLTIKRALSEAKDIHNRKVAEDGLKLFRALIDHSNDAIEVIDPVTHRFIDVNDTACRTLGYNRDELLSMNIQDISPEIDNLRLNEIDEVLQQHQSTIIETHRCRKDGSTFLVEVNLTGVRIDKEYVVAVVRDITDRKLSEETQKRLVRALKLLSKCNKLLVHAEKEQDFLTELCKLTVETGGYMTAWVGFKENDTGQTVRLVAQSGYEEGYLGNTNITWADTERGQGQTGTAIRSEVIVVNQDWLTYPKNAPWRKAAIKHGYRSSIALPLISNNNVLGALTIYAAEPYSFGKEEVALLEELARDLVFGIETLRTRVEHEHHATILRESLEQSIQTLAGTLEARDPYTAGHQRRVGELAKAIAREMGLSEEQIHGIYLAAIIHDMGKIRIPSEILSKPGKLTHIEYMLIQTHSQAGYDILKDVSFPWPIADIVLQHHEKLDGSGYPQGLKDKQILLESRIMAVADVVEAMSSHRPYRPALGIKAALNEIERGRGSLYDPLVSDACQRLFAEKNFTFTLG